MYSCHLLLWPYHQQRLHSQFWHSYASTEDRLLIASSRFELLRMYSAEVFRPIPCVHRRKMSTHALEKITRDLFRAMSLAPRQKCLGNVVEMKGAMAAFFGSDSVAISCHCKRSKNILVKVLT